jgi:hypothetical protein
MIWDVSDRGIMTLVLCTVVMIVLCTPLYAGMNLQNEDLDMGTHDYIMDKQQSLNCSMVQMNDSELSDVTAAGFSSFEWEDSVAKAYFNIQTSTFTEIQSLKMGFYNSGWDEDWTNVSLGSASEDLLIKGVFIEASFSNLTDPENRSLDSLRIGTPSLTGPITANFNSFSGCIQTAGTTIVNQSRGPLNSGLLTTIYSNPNHNDNDNNQFFMQLSKSGTAATPGVPAAPAGWWFYWGNATITTH